MNAPSPHPSPRELADHAARRLPATDVLRLSDHLAECAVCQAALARLRQPAERRLGAFVIDPPAALPSFDDLAGELDGTLAPARREEFALELARSPEAREALADLAAFRDGLVRLPIKHHRADDPPRTPPVGGDAGKVVTPPHWRWRTAAAWATGLAALFVALAAGWWVFARNGENPSGLLRDAGGRAAELAALPAGLRMSVETAARTGQLPPQGSTLATGREILAGPVAGTRMTAISPVGIVVREVRPSLHWTPREGATGYMVSYSATDGGPLVTSPLLPAALTQWTPPQALQRGTSYQWQVEAFRGESVIDRAPKPPAGEARFQILDPGSNDALEKVEGQDSGFPLILGVAYWRAGLAAAAAEQFHRLAQANAQSPVAQRLARAAAADASPPAPVSPNSAR